MMSPPAATSLWRCNVTLPPAVVASPVGSPHLIRLLYLIYRKIKVCKAISVLLNCTVPTLASSATVALRMPPKDALHPEHNVQELE